MSVTIRQAAKELNITKQGVLILINHGHIPAKRTAKGIRINEVDIAYRKEVYKQRERRRHLIKSYQNLREISIDSARRWVERQEEKGYDLNDIANEIYVKQVKLVTSKHKEMM